MNIKNETFGFVTENAIYLDVWTYDNPNKIVRIESEPKHKIEGKFLRLAEDSYEYKCHVFTALLNDSSKPVVYKLFGGEIAKIDDIESSGYYFNVLYIQTGNNSCYFMI